MLTRHDMDFRPQFRALWHEERVQLERMGAELLVPLRAKGELVGILAVGPKRSGNAFSQDDRRVLSTLADRVAIALENARLYREVGLRAERMAAVNRVGRAVRATLQLDDLIGVVYREVAAILKADAFFLALYDTETAELDYRVQIGGDAQEPAQCIPLGIGLTAQVVLWKAPVLVRDVDQERAALPDPSLWEKMQVPASWLGVPMLVGEKVIGVISVQSYCPNAYSHEEQLLLSTIADQVAVAVQDARLHSELQETLALLRTAHWELEERVRVRTADLAQANVALQAEIAERLRAEQQIRASLREKEVLLQEIHHRVKNNLQVVSSLLNLQASTIDDQQVVRALEESHNRIRTMALIHEKLYQSEDLGRINFAEYVHSLVGFLHRTYNGNTGRVDLDIQADAVMLQIDSAIPCGLILNELVSNALKHAFPDGRRGQVHIAVRAPHNGGSGDQGENGHVTLMISDDGVGFPPGFDFAATESLGLRLVETLCRQLGAQFQLNSDHGTRFSMTFTSA